MEGLEAEGGGNDNVIHANERSNTTSSTTDLVPISEDDKRRSSVRHEFFVVDGASFPDGKKRARCSHCKTATFIALSNYGTSNMRKHLEKCKAYQATKKESQEEGG
uniref:BED-type domain-containing protein n=1 Tax=Opuntia streptacantha TaxID=393608 RepID=A0A7C9DX17_OPUST